MSAAVRQAASGAQRYRVAVDFPPAPQLFDEPKQQEKFNEWYLSLRRSILQKLESLAAEIPAE